MNDLDQLEDKIATLRELLCAPYLGKKEQALFGEWMQIYNNMRAELSKLDRFKSENLLKLMP